jgi:hypothetical protein
MRRIFQTGLALFMHQRNHAQDGHPLVEIVYLRVQFRESCVARTLAPLVNGGLRTRIC